MAFDKIKTDFFFFPRRVGSTEWEVCWREEGGLISPWV